MSLLEDSLLRRSITGEDPSKLVVLVVMVVLMVMADDPR